MGQGLLNQGAWSQLSQGAWQVQSQAFSDTLSDSVTTADSLTAGAGIALVESITPADAVIADATKVLSDSVTLADALIAYAAKVLADSVTPAETLIADAAKVLADSVTPADTLTASGSGVIVLTDSVTPAETLIADAAKVLADSVTPADTLTASGSGVIVLTDSVTPADVLVSYVAKVLADSVTPSDALAASGSGVIILTDSVTPADALVSYATKVLSDSITLADALIVDAAKVLADSLTPADALVSSAAKLLADSLTPAETLIASAIIVLTESVTLSDLLSAAGGVSLFLSDSISASDSLLADAIKGLSDSVSLSDSLGGHPAPGILTPIGYEAPVPILCGPKGTQQGITAVDNHPRPLCALVTSGSNTLYTATSVEDTAGWDLSDVARHNVVATQDGYVGEVLSTLGNVVTLTSWHAPGGSDLAGKAADKPADGQGATIHKVIRAASVLISSDRVNNKFVWLGMSNAVTPDRGFPISNDLGAKNAYLTLIAGLAKYINLSRIWVVAGSAQTLHWTTDGSVGEPTGSTGIDDATLVDRAHTSDALAVSAGKVLADSVSVLDSLSGVLTPMPGPFPMPAINDVEYFSGSDYVALSCAFHIDGGVLIFDVSDPTTPTRVGWVDIGVPLPIALPTRLAIAGTLAYLATNFGLVIVDISDPTAPVEISTLSMYTQNIPATGIDVDFPRCYIATQAEGLKIIDITDPLNPLELPGHNFDTQFGAYTYIDSFSHGPFTCGRFTYPTPPGEDCFPYGVAGTHGFTGGKGVKVEGAYIYITGAGRIWRLHRTDTPTVDRIWTICTGPAGTGLPESFDVSAGDVYLHESHNFGILPSAQLLDQNLNSIVDSGAMTNGWLSTLPWGLGYPKTVYSGGYMYTLRWEGISAVNFGLAPPEQMALTLEARGFAVNGNYLYIGVNSGGWSLRVYDISIPSAPVLVGTGT